MPGIGSSSYQNARFNSHSGPSSWPDGRREMFHPFGAYSCTTSFDQYLDRDFDCSYMKDQVVDHLSTAIEPCLYLSLLLSKAYRDFSSQCPPASLAPVTATTTVTSHIKGKKMGIDMAVNQPGKVKKRRRRVIRTKQQGFT